MDERTPPRAARLAARIRESVGASPRVRGGLSRRIENGVESYEGREPLPGLVTTAGALATTAGVAWMSAKLQVKKAVMEAKWLSGVGPSDDPVIKAREAYLEGRSEADLANTSPFKEGGLKDPTKLLYVPVSVWISTALGVTSYFMKDTTAGSFFEGMFYGSAAGALGASVYSWAVAREASEEA